MTAYFVVVRALCEQPMVVNAANVAEARKKALVRADTNDRWRRCEDPIVTYAAVDVREDAE